jgi:hypothetical protein
MPRLFEGVYMRYQFRFLFRALAALALIAPVSLITTLPVSAAPLSATGACATGTGNAGGEGIICQVTIVNTVTASGGSAVVTVHECLGSAGAPTDGALGHTCTTTTTSLSTPVTSIIQCNGSANGGGATLNCAAVITNNFVGVSPGSTAVTVNQCIGSGDGVTTGCNPFPATTTGAAITQCNSSANGGGLVGMSCIATGMMSSALVVTINQCNGSGLGGGGKTNCSASMANNAVAALPSPSSSAAASPSPSSSAAASPSPSSSAAASPVASPASGTPPTSSTTNDGPSNNSTPSLALLISFALAGLVFAVVLTKRQSIHL